MFFLSGVATVMIGQLLPILSGRFGLTDLGAGYFFPAQFSGSLAGTLFSNWFGRRSGFLTATVIGCVFMAAGILVLNSGVFWVCLVGFTLIGLGTGLTLPSINMLVVEMNPLGAASALSVLNFCWGVGAILCKPFVDATTSAVSILPMSLLLAAPLLVGALLGGFSGGTDEVLHRGPIYQEPGVSRLPIWTTTLAWVIALFNFIHVGFESGMGGWLTTYADRLQGGPVVNLLSPTFLYFFFFVAGRGAAPVFFRVMTEDQVLLMDLGIMLAGMLILLSAGDLVWLGVGASAAGFGTSSVFPTNLARFTRIFGPTASRRATTLFICGTLGSAGVTWIIGFLSVRLFSLRSGMSSLLACVVVLLILQILLTLLKPKTDRATADRDFADSG